MARLGVRHRSAADLLAAASPKLSARLETRDSYCPKGGCGPSPAWPLSALTNDMQAVLVAANVRPGLGGCQQVGAADLHGRPTPW